MHWELPQIRPASCQAIGITDTKIIPFLKKLEVESVDFRIMVNLNSKIRKASHKNKTGLRVIIDCH